MNVTIVGGGFGGVKTALELSKDARTRVTLISDKPDFQYYPALYNTATGHSHRESWVSLKTVFEGKKNIHVKLDSIKSIDPEKKQVIGNTAHHYDTLVLALGSVTTYFGIEGLDTYAFGIKSQEEIRRLQAHLFNEMSDGKDDEKHYVIIGAGPTGVELAGALGEYVRVLRKHFGIRKKTLRIDLVEAAPRVLPRSSQQTSKRAHKRLHELGVHVEVNKKVERETANELIVNGKPLETHTVIWTSGVTNAPFYKENARHFSFNERGKVVVDDYMMARPSVYVIGDNAATPYAGLAQTALHDAQFIAKHLSGKTRPYKAVYPPTVVPIGHNWALFEWGKLRFGGLLGAFMRHAADIIGYHDILPIGHALSTWRSGSKQELRIPDSLANPPKH